MFFFREDKRGFTLIELIVVIALITVLATLVISNVRKHRMKARDHVRVADIDKIRIALEQYKLACGEYPERLESDVNNGCAYGQKLSNFLPHIPVNPQYNDNPSVKLQVSSNSDSQIKGGINTYLYSALSNQPSGKCYDYHLGVFFESSKNSFLENDHDAKKGKVYTRKCRGANIDFDGEDTDYGPYDFRSKSSYAS